MAAHTDNGKATISQLVAQYFQLVEPWDLRIPSADTLKDPAVQAAIYEQMFNENNIDPIPPVNYRTRVLKTILSRIEESLSSPEEDEILDDLMTCWSELIAQPKPSALDAAQQLSYIKYTAPVAIDDDNDKRPYVITSESRGLILSSGTTGFRTWEAALHLGTFLSTPEGQSVVRGKRVIELGAGTGFLSLYCARHLVVENVTVTDRDPALISNIRDCLRRNQLRTDKIRPAIWEWGSPLDSSSSSNIPGDESLTTFDVALGADLTYDVDIVPLLVSTIRDLFDHYGTKEFILSATIRNEETFQTFLDTCEANRFQTHRIPFESPPFEDQSGFFHSTRIPIRTYRIMPPERPEQPEQPS
ncbi:hypothetical protein VTN77DRAFT_8539 [Rasamsonia byssochlamydoides]|uniref:uncharacterized protein n=1 Tax=Rasamsonia byssochlamydoides TaxID=89139 RepID=UPI003742356A